MKRFIYYISCLVLLYSCNQYDDAWIKQEFEEQNLKLNQIEAQCQRINDNITAVETILSSLEEKDIIKSFTAITDGGEIVGYEFVFQKTGVVKVYHGKSGDKGEDGADPHKPLISVKKAADGKWYWTINGQWCLDNEGNKVPAISDDEVTPVFMIKEGYWYVSLDKGQTWGQIGVADGTDGDLMLSDVTYDDYIFYLSLADGSVIEVPRMCNLSIELGEVPSQVKAGSDFLVDYEVKGGLGNAMVTCVGEHGWTAKIIASDNNTGYINISAPATLTAGKVVIFVAEGDYTIMKAIAFEGEQNNDYFMTSKFDYYEVDATGGYIDVVLTTNQDYSVNIPEDAKTWISYVETRAVKTDKVRLGISFNAPGHGSRESKVKFEGTHDSVIVIISQKAAPYIDSEIDLGPIDGFEDPENGIVVLQQATKGAGTDIVIMGDGFVEKHFRPGGRYETLMKQAYEDFFSVEPYASLKEYFNVYYINVLSEDEHDARPYYDSYGNQNGAVQGSAVTKLRTVFTPGSTSITGDDQEVLRYATQAIQMKGATDAGKCTYADASARANEALVIVLPNVNCYAGTCTLAWRNSAYVDYADLYSIAYTALGGDGVGRELKYTLLHEAGGHGFGKLADEYSSSSLTRFNTSEWIKLSNYHSYGVYRNVNEYWTYEESLNWSGLNWEYTNSTNVYWAELLDDSYGYSVTEGLGLYRGAYTYSSLFCRPTVNSLMNNQLASDGQFFNAISRWAIWYRLMKLTDSISTTDFKASLDEFIAFDETLTIYDNESNMAAAPHFEACDDFRPLGTPVLQECDWQGDVLVIIGSDSAM